MAGRTEGPAPRTRAVAYIRVSTEKQADDGFSLGAQRERVQQYAALYDLELVEIIEDAGESASTLERPGLQRALAMLEDGTATAVLVVKLDRLTRSVRDLGDLLERYFSGEKYALLSVSEQFDTRSAAGRLVLNVLASIFQWEREAIGERTSAALRFKASRGEFTGGKPPYGWRVAEDGIHLEPHPTEQGLVNEARRLRGLGLSLRDVSEKMAAQGLVGRRGQALAPIQIARMVSA